MNCPFCGTANPDEDAFCMQCGKQLKNDKQVPIPSAIETDSSSREETLTGGEDNKLTNSSDATSNVDSPTIIAPQKMDNQEDDSTLLDDTVSLSAVGQIKEPATEDVQKDLSSSTDEPAQLAQSTSSTKESHPVIEEMPTQIAPAPVIEPEQTQIGTQTSPESTLQQEQTVVEPQHDADSQSPIAVATLPGDPVPSDDPTSSEIVQSPIPQQEQLMYPGYPENAHYPGTPSSPYYAGYPTPDGTYQSVPSYPMYPGYPQGQPPDAYQTNMSGTQYPPVNAYPPLPGSYQTGGTATYPYAPVMMQQPADPKRITRIAKPLPRPILILCIVAILVILGVLQATGSDWADGAIRAAIGAIIIAVLLLAFAGIRTFLGMANETNTKRRVQYIGSGLAITLLFVYSGLNLIGQTPLHALQAHYVEGQQTWQQAINEYTLSGEKAPTSTNLARVYDEWGEALNQSGHYTDALSKFNVTLNDYTTPNEITRAQQGEINSYFSLGKQAAQNNNYASATKEFDTALGLSFCHRDCQNRIAPSDATAYYNLAQSQLQAQQWNDAVDNFKTVQSRFVSYPEAKKTHGYLATALYGKGKQDKANVCTSAVPTYQDLATNFSDTPEGKDAADALSQPQPVTGHFTSPLPTDAIPIAVLTSTPINGNMTNDQFGPIIENSSITALVNSDGTFKFAPQKQGTYDLAWVNILNDGSAIYSIFYYLRNDPAKPASFVANVGPLCPFDFGDIAEPIAH